MMETRTARSLALRSSLPGESRPNTGNIHHDNTYRWGCIMSRRFQDKGRISGAFVPMLVATMKAPAWRALSHGARSLFLALKSRYDLKQHNNGRLYLSTRR